MVIGSQTAERLVPAGSALCR